ncbi:MAG: hypothetical protein Q3971_06155 [Moraxella sp.]|nr:hypothetical protein [Moraxella sp.]
MKNLIMASFGLAVLTGCQTLQTTKQPMPFSLHPSAKPASVPAPPQKNDPSDDEPFFLLERWF